MGTAFDSGKIGFDSERTAVKARKLRKYAACNASAGRKAISFVHAVQDSDRITVAESAY